MHRLCHRIVRWIISYYLEHSAELMHYVTFLAIMKHVSDYGHGSQRVNQ